MSLVKFLMGRGLSRSLFSSTSSTTSTSFLLPSSSARFFSTSSRLALPKSQTSETPKKKTKKTSDPQTDDPETNTGNETEAKSKKKASTVTISKGPKGGPLPQVLDSPSGDKTSSSSSSPSTSVKAKSKSPKTKIPSPGRPLSSPEKNKQQQEEEEAQEEEQEGQETRNTLKRQIGKASRSLVSEGVKEKAVQSLIARTVLSPSHPREDLYDLPPPPPPDTPEDPLDSEDSEDQGETGPQERKGRKRVEKEVKRQKVTEGTVVTGQSLADRIEALVKGVPGHVLELEMQRVKSTLSARSHGRPIPLAALSPSSRDSLALKARLEALSPAKEKRAKEGEEEGLEEVVYSKGMAVAYMVHQMPVTCSVLRAVFHTLDSLLPDFAPRSLLDFGSGTGSALWAARDVWGPSQLVHSVLVEPSSEMSSLADRLLHNHNLKEGVEQRHFMNLGREREEFDVVVAGFTMTSLRDSKERRNAVRGLWQSVAEGGTLVLVDYGTSFSHSSLMDLRSLLLSEHPDASLLAPCPHSLPCPFLSSDPNPSPSLSLSNPLVLDPADTQGQEGQEGAKRRKVGGREHCSFVQRIALTKSLRSLRRSQDNILLMPYSYLIFRRTSSSSTSSTSSSSSSSSTVEGEKYARVVDVPKKRGGHVVMEVCTPEGELEKMTVAQSHGQEWYRSARACAPGDGMAFPLPPKKPSLSRKPSSKSFDPLYRSLTSSTRYSSSDPKTKTNTKTNTKAKDPPSKAKAKGKPKKGKAKDSEDSSPFHFS